MVKRLAFLLLFAPSLLHAGGTVFAGKGPGTVKAVKGAGNANMVVFAGYQPPGAFRVTSLSTNSITAAWNAALTPDATGYRLHISTSADFFNVTSIVTQALTGTFTGLNVNQLYYLHVQSAYYGGIDSAWSSTLSSATLSTIPVAVLSTWTVTTTSVGALWDRGDNPADTTLYTVQLSTVSDLASGTVYSSSTYFVSSTFTALTAGNTYFAQVKSVSIANISSSFLHLGSTRTLAVTGPTLVQSSCTSSANATHTPYNLGWNTAFTAGNMSLSGVVDTGESMGTGDLTDTVANSYTAYPANGPGNAGSRVALFVATNTATGGSFRVTPAPGGGSSGINSNMCNTEWAGATIADETATTTANNSAPTINFTLGTAATCVAMLTWQTGGTTTITASDTEIGKQENNTTFQAYGMQYGSFSSGAQSMSWTASGAIDHAIDLVCFR